MYAFLLTVIFAFLLYLNYLISDGDYFSPSLLFCGMNFISALLCVVACNIYDMEFHLNTVLVLTTGGVIFTFTNYYYKRFRFRKKMVRTHKTVYQAQSRLHYMKIRRLWIVLFILFELLVAFFYANYVQRAVKTFYGSNMGLVADIGRFNFISKSRWVQFKQLGVGVGAIYTYGWPLCIAVNLIWFAVSVCNYYCTHKFDVLVIVSYILMIATSLIGGSRSNAFRFLCAAFIIWIIIKRIHLGSYKKGNKKILFRLLLASVVLVYAFYFAKDLLGRTKEFVWYEYILAYIGAPFLNLDIYLNESMKRSEFFGQETFYMFYTWIGTRFGIGDLMNYSLDLPYNYHNGIYLGNVYTMYYQFIHDFGYLGVAPLTLLIAIYYNSAYYKLMNLHSKKPVLGLRLFIYAFLFNSLIMLTFSNRFFEDAIRITSLRMYIWMIVFWYAFKQMKIKIGKGRIW